MSRTEIRRRPAEPARQPCRVITALVAASAVASLCLAACGGGDDDGPVARVAGCVDCHAEPVSAAQYPSSHSLLYDCEFCHGARSDEPGPGHRDTPACATCHSEVGHPQPPSTAPPAIEPAAAPAGAPPAPSLDPEPAGGLPSGANAGCTRCHEPHGSPNLFLIRQEIDVPGGGVAAIDLRNALGRADFGFAELGAGEGGTNGREPGTGVCEVCHSGTRYYDSRGTGAPHHVERCGACHSHARSFAVD